MKTKRFAFVVAALAAAFVVLPPASAVSVGQVDTFEDGTTQNWAAGLLGAPHPVPPVNTPSGGPAGVDDNYLYLASVGGSGPGSRLSVINLSQWTGDYISSGVGSISMDVNNLGPDALALRLMFADPIGGPPSNLAFSLDPILVPAGSGWLSIEFPVAPGALVAGSGSVTAALSGATEVRLYHSIARTFPGEAIVAGLGVDNIRAHAASAGTSVPEGSSTAMLLGVALVATTCRRLRTCGCRD